MQSPDGHGRPDPGYAAACAETPPWSYVTPDVPTVRVTASPERNVASMR